MVTLETGVEGQADRSLSRRASYVSVAWDRFVESPLIGHGPLSYPELYAKSEHAPLFGRSKTRVNKGYQRPAHNTYLETLVETGLAGLAAFVALLFVGWRNFSQSVSRFRQLGYMRLADLTRAYQVAFLSQLIYFLFLSQTFAKLAWVALGMSVIAVRLSKRHVEDENIPKNLTELTRSSG
jgi:O-antigen ligase